MKHRCVAMVIWKSVFKIEKQRQKAWWPSPPSQSSPPFTLLVQLQSTLSANTGTGTKHFFPEWRTHSETNSSVRWKCNRAKQQRRRPGSPSTPQLHELHCAAGNVWLWSTALGFHRIRAQLPTAVSCIVSPLGPVWPNYRELSTFPGNTSHFPLPWRDLKSQRSAWELKKNKTKTLWFSATYWKTIERLLITNLLENCHLYINA